jgi:hypothetical protein
VPTLLLLLLLLSLLLLLLRVVAGFCLPSTTMQSVVAHCSLATAAANPRCFSLSLAQQQAPPSQLLLRNHQHHLLLCQCDEASSSSSPRLLASSASPFFLQVQFLSAASLVNYILSSSGFDGAVACVYFLSAIVVDDEEFDWITLFFVCVCVDMEAF